MGGTSRDIAGDTLLDAQGPRRLDTWKEIGGFFGRDERTVKRWEAVRGLPVHRVPGGGRPKVYAYVHELAAWLAGPGQPEAAGPAVEPGVTEAIPAPVAPLDAPPQPEVRSRPRFDASLALGLLLASLLAIVSLSMPGRLAGRYGRLRARDPQALQLYRQGLHDWNTRTPEGLHLAVDEFTQAIVRAPDYAEAYVGLANCYNLLREYTNMAPSVAYPRAKAAALRALALDDSLAGAHRALAFEQFYWEWNAPVAMREFRRALALDPNAAITHHWYANVLLHLGRFDQALAEINKAEDLDPVATSILADRGLILNDAGHKDEAITSLQQIEQTSPAYLSPHIFLSDMYLQYGDAAGYLRELTTAAGLLHDDVRTAIAAAATAGWKAGGRRGMLQSMLATQLSLEAQGQLSPYEVARTYARLGDTAHALNLLALSKARRDPSFMAIRVDPALANLRGLQAYKALQAGLAGDSPTLG